MLGELSFEDGQASLAESFSNIDKDWTWLGGANIRDCTQDGDCDPGYSCKWKLCSLSHMNLCVADTDCPNGETCSGFIDGPASSTAANDGYPCFMAPGFGSQMHSECRHRP